MGKPLMIQLEDATRIEKLKEKLGAKTKIEVVRTALGLLEADVLRAERVRRWQKSARIVGRSGLEIFKDFQVPNRFKNLP